MGRPRSCFSQSFPQKSWMYTVHPRADPAALFTQLVFLRSHLPILRSYPQFLRDALDTRWQKSICVRHFNFLFYIPLRWLCYWPHQTTKAITVSTSIPSALPILKFTLHVHEICLLLLGCVLRRSSMPLASWFAFFLLDSFLPHEVTWCFRAIIRLFFNRPLALAWLYLHLRDINVIATLS